MKKRISSTRWLLKDDTIRWDRPMYVLVVPGALIEPCNVLANHSTLSTSEPCFTLDGEEIWSASALVMECEKVAVEGLAMVEELSTVTEGE